MSRIGLIGGSFDPIHLGHIEMAKQAKRQLQLDEVWFVLSYDTPLKDRTLSNYDARKKMVKLALNGFDGFKLCTIEETSNGKNYTIDTVGRLKTQHKDATFFFMIGGDQIKQLNKWKDIEKLQSEVQLCGFMRDGETVDTPYNVRMLSMEPYPISSSEIREGKLKYLHPKVKDYIVENFLYEGIVSSYMSEYRYNHSVSVAKLCVNLAKAHHLDEQIAYMCGIYHDINKEFIYINEDDGRTLVSQLRPELIDVKKSIWHGFLGAYVCGHNLGIRDKRVLAAVEHHVLGEHLGIYSKLLYIADKLDPLRGDTSELLAYAYKDIHLGYQEVKEDQMKCYGKEYVDGEKIRSDIERNQ
ncbi:nicotinate (nicotinamide) nucleotide adenylyltransferase [Breznakia pachnodae]|uniref:Probable nicotinate-nucleotide adenylyltransferase n=1 Tax=Breznakia pachnodae TaxID=265178 RepID=A0ABU0E438_9FIRM|nr:nicotinate (nicotinamide) nucleotide adenylyltransferase [Breznakia pachnodae]MDQ0361668.1 nicotinate-nucleotide adenylyltransferase [Breznakia pachnodae]